MLVQYWMSRPVVSVQESASIETALRQVKHHGISTLPIVRDHRPIGLVFRDDLDERIISLRGRCSLFEFLQLLRSTRIDAVMRTQFDTIPFDHTIEEAAELLLGKNLPSVMATNSDGELAGMIARSDILRVMIDLTGVSRRGIQFGFQVADRPGSVKALTDLIRSYGGRLVSILTTNEGVPEGFCKTYIRTYGIDRFRLFSLTDALKKTAEIVYVLDRLEVCRRKPASGQSAEKGW